jgi:hypothetical protein
LISLPDLGFQYAASAILPPPQGAGGTLPSKISPNDETDSHSNHVSNGECFLPEIEVFPVEVVYDPVKARTLRR